MTKTRSRNPWKILILAIIGCAAGFTILLAGAVYWIASAWSAGRSEVERRGRIEVVEVPQTPTRIQRVEPRSIPQTPTGNPAAAPPLPSDSLLFPPIPGEEREIPAAAPSEPNSTQILRLGRTSDQSYPGADIFRDGFIPRLEIMIPREGMASLRRNDRTYVPATLREGNVVYTNVAIHLKGGPGSYRPLDNTPAWTVNFDKFAEGQKFHGLKKIHLNNSVQDRSFLSEKLSRELFEAAGVPVPRAGNAVVTLNGRLLGLYVLVEGVNKQFLKRYFNDVTGNVYDGHSQTDVTHSLPTNDGENRGDKSRLRALAAAVRQPLSARLASLESTLDLDRFLSFVAMETILWHWDGYTMNRNNFRIYHDRDTDRMVFLPHGMDQILSKSDGPVYPPTAGLVARQVLEIPEARRRYEDRITQLSKEVFRPEAITNRLFEVAERIQATLEEINPGEAGAHRRRAISLARQFQSRAASLQRDLFPATVLRLDERDVVALTEWYPKIDLGDARLTREQDADGRTLLRISSARGCTASWRTRLLLAPGQYRFEARLKTQGVVLDPSDQRAGAGLRVSRYRTGQKNDGDREWIPVTFDLDVPNGQGETILVCELRADQGDVWFDLNSLRLRVR